MSLPHRVRLEPAYDETLPADHARAMAPTLANAFRHHGVEAVVFDGNVPRDALVMAAAGCAAPSSGCAGACGGPTRASPDFWSSAAMRTR